MNKDDSFGTIDGLVLARKIGELFAMQFALFDMLLRAQLIDRQLLWGRLEAQASDDPFNLANEMLGALSRESSLMAPEPERHSN